MRNQSQDETFDKYVTELKILASTCNYGALHDSLIRDRLICGINDSNLRERLLRVADLDLQKCLEICRAAELSKERIETPSASLIVVLAYIVKIWFVFRNFLISSSINTLGL
jgi:hypothetical protein